MKKIVAGVVVFVISFMIIGCGPNYTEEFDAAVELYNNTIEEREKSFDEADKIMQHSEDFDVVEEGFDMVAEAYDTMREANVEAISVYEPLLLEVKGYEEGISDKEMFFDFVSTLEEEIEFLKVDIDDYESWKKHALIYKRYYRLAFEFDDYIGEIDSVDISALSDDEYEEFLNNGIKHFKDVKGEIVEMQKEIKNLSVSEDREFFDETIEEFDVFVKFLDDSIADLNKRLESLN